jgi:hypothetical protein
VSGGGRCAIALTAGAWTVTAPDDVGLALRKSLLGASRALQVSIDGNGGAMVSGLRIDSDRTTTVFSAEPWPANVAEERAAARRLIARVTAR